MHLFSIIDRKFCVTGGGEEMRDGRFKKMCKCELSKMYPPKKPKKVSDSLLNQKFSAHFPTFRLIKNKKRLKSQKKTKNK